MSNQDYSADYLRKNKRDNYIHAPNGEVVLVRASPGPGGGE